MVIPKLIYYTQCAVDWRPYKEISTHHYASLQPRVAAADTIAGFHEEGKSPFVKSPMKTILHQGEVGLIICLPQLVTANGIDRVNLASAELG